jgi:hypothetical protein
MTLEPSAERTQKAMPSVIIKREMTSNKCCQQKEIILSFIPIVCYFIFGLQNYTFFGQYVLRAMGYFRVRHTAGQNEVVTGCWKNRNSVN